MCLKTLRINRREVRRLRMTASEQLEWWCWPAGYGRKASSRAALPAGLRVSIRLRFARRSRERRRPRCRDTARCFQASCGQGAAARPSCFSFAGRSRLAWYAGSSAFRTRRGSRPISLTQPSTIRAYCRVPSAATHAVGSGTGSRPPQRRRFDPSLNGLSR